MNRKEFEKIVCEALKSLPKRFKDRLRNIDVVIEDSKTRKDLLGLYEGVPIKDRTRDYNMMMPDKITLFKRNLEDECKVNKTDLRQEIRRTVEHEIAHHFGITDERLEEEAIY